jgi:hypothetical protein
MRSIGIAGTFPASDLHDATIVVPRFGSLTVTLSARSPRIQVLGLIGA